MKKQISPHARRSLTLATALDRVDGAGTPLPADRFDVKVDKAEGLGYPIKVEGGH